MAKINARSPYFIKYTDTDITSAVLNLYIYQGASVATMDEVSYSIESTVINGVVTFEISQLISDYIDTVFDGSFTSSVVWLNYQVTKSILEVAQTPEAVVTIPVFDGYGYFEEGANPQGSDKLLQSNKTIYTYDGNTFYVPIQQDTVDYIDLKYQGVEIGRTGTEGSYAYPNRLSINITTRSKDIIRYISYTNPKRCAGTINYLFEDRNNYIYEDSNNFVFDDLASEVDEVFIKYLDGSSETVYIKIISEPKYTPYRVTFVNKFGAIQNLWMFKRSNLSLSVESENYRGYLMNNSSYNTSEHQYRNYNVSGRESVTLNSGFYPEDYNDVFRQVLLSENVWIDYEGYILPVNIKSKELMFKTRVDDKLINYTIDFEFAFDKINSVY